jgi:alanine dehydrogenase
MQSIKIGVLKEGKIPVDRRVPLTPTQAKQLEDLFPDVKVVVQKSPVRCFDDNLYSDEDIEVVDNILECDILFGVKEVPIIELMDEKTYMFFSHTTKEQPYNRELLREILRKNIRLIDYEKLTDKKGNRLIAFGRYAGIVGAYNGIWAYGKRQRLFNLRRAYTCRNLDDLKTEYAKAELPPVKIVITGSGRAGKGAVEVLFGMGIRKVGPEEFLNEEFDSSVYTQLSSSDYNSRKDGKEFERVDFHTNPTEYKSDFLKFAHKADILIASAFWDPHAPKLFAQEDILSPDFKIKVIADITCDIEGSIPSTKRPSTIVDPLYDYNPKSGLEEKALSSESNITVMAIDNLPCELPVDASYDFGKQLIANVIPPLIGKDDEGVIKRSTITQNGHLTDEFQYLDDYVKGK